MRPGSFRCFALLLVFATCFSANAAAVEVGGLGADSAPVSLSANKLDFDQETGVYHATGGVQLQQGELTLESEEIIWDTESQEATARGGVRLSDPSGFMEGESLTYNLESGKGALTAGRIFLREGNFQLAGDEIAKIGVLTYRIRGGSFTTCNGEVPSWKFGARNFRVTDGEFAQAKHVTFYVRDIPVLYLPYFIFPAVRERTSGFLLPSYGYSQKRGTEFTLSYYQVIDRNQDATFTLDYHSELGVGKGLEYRYILGQDNVGQFDINHVTGVSGADDRYHLQLLHQGTLPGQVQLMVDVQQVSNRDYFEDFGEEPEEYNRDQVQSVVYARRNWNLLNLSGQFKYTKDLEQNNDQTLQRLPELHLVQIRRSLAGSPLYGGFDASATYFWRDEGLRGERVNLRPYLAAAFRPGGVVEVMPEIGYRQRLYWTSEGEASEGMFDFSTRVSTRFFRVYSEVGKEIRKIRHSIEPELVYTYVPYEDQRRLPQFDTEDEVGQESRLTYQLTNRFVARLEPEEGPPVYHEFLFFRLSQSYDFRQSPSDPLVAVEAERPFSELRGEMILRPTRWSYVDLDARFDVYATENNPAAFYGSGGFQDGAGNGIAMNYRYRRQDLEYVAGTLDLAVMRPVYLHYRHRYDLQEVRSLEQLLALEYRASCWSVALSLRDRLEDTEYMVTFSLAGLGRIGQVGGELGYE